MSARVFLVSLVIAFHLAGPGAARPAHAAPAPREATGGATGGATQGVGRVAAHAERRKPLPGCSDDLAGAVREKLERMGAPASASDLEELWASPCLAHFARFFPIPRGLDGAALAELWNEGLADAVWSAVGGFEVRNDTRVFVVPPAPRPTLTEHDRRALAPWTCADSEAGCERTLSYRMRAEEAFARSAKRDRERFAVSETEGHGTDPCSGSLADVLERRMTRFEAWASCVIEHAPSVHRYARVSLREPERGWLILRGRRGHYAFADELRAYDLATGAAYVVRSRSELVLEDDGHVDVPATDARRVPEAFTGTVAPEQARELAFVLVTARAVSPSRTYYVAHVPKDLVLELSRPNPELVVGGFGSTWGSSGHTVIAFALVDGGDVRASGTFTWPESSNPVDDHADGLIRVLEAGLVPGCAPARVPGGVLSRVVVTGVSRLDADPTRQDTVRRDLDRAFDSLRANACNGAR